MLVSRMVCGVAGAAVLFGAAPASAQFYFRGPDIASAPATGTEPGLLAQPLPGATPAELRAAIVWNVRAALNVAALQCQFAPTLLTLPNYNTILKDHGAELNASYATLSKYFLRTAKNAKAGQTALDQYGTRVYSSFSVVYSQLSFCATAHAVSEQAVFAPRGGFGDIAVQHIGELRNSLTRWGEMQFPMVTYYGAQVNLPQFGNEKCWRKDVYRPERCA
ncbi:hypothetical protein [Sphingomonas sp.]|uniref:hypothetical protein n=1 Tax=Sphingomonas sp. TaxID=28214 RepID=UPI001ED0212D|nr:hypothetical protein [Sphingomonas sp.]MBX3594102.1 hypothetical protein [Sphingomonas sp.]